MSSLIASATFPLTLWLDPSGRTPPSSVVMAFAVAAPLLILYLHRANLRRRMQGTDNRFDKARLFHRPPPHGPASEGGHADE